MRKNTMNEKLKNEDYKAGYLQALADVVAIIENRHGDVEDEKSNN